MPEPNEVTIMVNCGPCKGTGLVPLRTLGAKPGVYVRCTKCLGKGSRDITRVRFTGRKYQEGVKKVYIPKDGFLGASPVPVTYGEFIALVPPPWPTRTAADHSYETLLLYHGCTCLNPCHDEQGDTACWANLNEARAFPCKVDSPKRLLLCMDYDGPLEEELKKQRYR